MYCNFLVGSRLASQTRIPPNKLARVHDGDETNAKLQYLVKEQVAN
jgi:hypothetical protein